MTANCPTPLKYRATSQAHAYKHARSMARTIINRGDHFDPVYGYLCPCGSWHITRRPTHEGTPNTLLYEVADHLQAFAQQRPTDAPQ